MTTPSRLQRIMRNHIAQTRSQLQPAAHQGSTVALHAQRANDEAAHLQRTVGNQTLAHLGKASQTALFAPGAPSLLIQTKLTLGPVGDQYEQEADQVAKAVVGQLNGPTSQAAGQAEAVQRAGAPEEEEMLQGKRLVQRQTPEEDELKMKPHTAALQRQALPEEEEKLTMKPLAQRLQRSASQTGGIVDETVESAINQNRGSGRPLTDGVRTPMEQAFGANFGGVRVHTNSTANTLNQSLQARAFTTGQDIFFRQGEYNPGSAAGNELLAHELTHVVQQNGAAVQREENQHTSP